MDLSSYPSKRFFLFLQLGYQQYVIFSSLQNKINTTHEINKTEKAAVTVAMAEWLVIEYVPF